MVLISNICLLGVLPLLAQAKSSCPLLGPTFPPPESLSTSPSFQAALKNLTQFLSQVQTSGNTSYVPFDAANTSYSLGFFSTHEETPLFTTHYTAPSLAAAQYGIKSVDSNSQYRIGSITKLIAVYAVLVADGFKHFNDPVTDFVPELLQAAESLNATKNPIDHVSWSDITLGDLASQQSGIGRDFAALGELGGVFNPIPDPTAFGLPPLNTLEAPVCEGGPHCTRARFFEGFTKRHPVYAPSTAAIYSNVAYQILAYALENITGTPFPELVENKLFKPLNLTGSSWNVPASNASGIVLDGEIWNLSLGDETPAGGMYSTLTDLSHIGRSILTSTLLAPSRTRKWFKPLSFVSDPQQAVGAPWEITRLPTSTSPNRLVDLYTKNGGLPGYNSVIVLVPDWKVGFVILSAGVDAETAVQFLGNLVAGVLLPAVEAAAREDAEKNYAGSYATAEQGLNSSITLSTSDSEPGIGISDWTSNGTDMLASQIGSSYISGPSARLYPTGLVLKVDAGEQEISFRAVYEDKREGTGGVFSCMSWVTVDSLYWGTVGTDEFVFRVGSDGLAKSVNPRALRVELVRSI